MLFEKGKSETQKDEFGANDAPSSTNMALFKDKDSINHRNMDDYISNIWMLASGIRETEGHPSGSHLLSDPSFVSTQEHKPNHIGCEPFGVKDSVTRLTEKRMCKCMYYYKEKSDICCRCQLESKWKNVGKIQIKDCEVPTKYVIQTVGGIDLLLRDKKGIVYSTEVKPKESSETLVRMMAEAYTMVAVGETYQPAICFFADSMQYSDFCRPEIYHDTAFQYLLTKIKVFYITFTPVNNVNEFIIHDNDSEPIIP